MLSIALKLSHILPSLIVIKRQCESCEKQVLQEQPFKLLKLIKTPLRNRWGFLYLYVIYYMSNITESFNQRIFLTPRADFVTDGQADLIKLIFARHGEKFINKIKLIDENDDYDSFLVETSDRGFCLKMSFDQVPIFYDYMTLVGIEHLNISPQAIGRYEIDYGKTIYYTMQTFEYSDNLASQGVSSILEESNINFFSTLTRLHTYQPPEEVWPHLDDIESYLQYHNLIFQNVTSYIERHEVEEFEFLKKFHKEVYDDMFSYFEKNKSKIFQKTLVHGNLDASTIISNNGNYKFINFENCFLGSPFFDLSNLVFELQMNGLKEYDFITKRIKDYELTQNRLKALNYLNEYKICKYIWTRKKLLDLICEYIKEVIILNKTRIDKLSRLGHYFANHFYRFSEINAFDKNRNILAQKYQSIILNEF